ncbi:MAG TPA: nuclear transport factor 2 family protein [Chthoniobacterales bacterium]
MNDLNAQTFMAALQKVEETHDVQSLVELFSDDCSLTNLAMSEPLEGRSGAQQFWEQYLHVFEEIRSRFFHTSETDQDIVLEWTSQGKLNSGEPVQYKGVSVIEKEGGKVAKFRTYYDSAAFTPLGKKG